MKKAEVGRERSGPRRTSKQTGRTVLGYPYKEEIFKSLGRADVAIGREAVSSKQKVPQMQRVTGGAETGL